MNEKTKIHVSEIIELAWCDKTSFDSIEDQTGLKEKEVIKIMRANLKPKSFRVWRERVSGRKAKHEKYNDGHKKTDILDEQKKQLT